MSKSVACPGTAFGFSLGMRRTTKRPVIRSLFFLEENAVNETSATEIYVFLATICGVSILVADVIVAEAGSDMSHFETPGRLASWTGVSPGPNEFAGRVKPPRPARKPLPQENTRHRRPLHRPQPQGAATSRHATSGLSFAAAR